ncbi:MAG: 1,4-alpha-glucan branching protein GlgB [Clostridiales bacterium]|nr:1,4-alpha-glucan branching protein GlgB [Clostridiales bacterium]
MKFKAGENFSCYTMFGSRVSVEDINGERVSGVQFTVWAPNALAVSVVGDFNYWDPDRDPMVKDVNGIWSLFITSAGEGSLYKYAIHTSKGVKFKSDPYAVYSELRPDTASVVYESGRYVWNDVRWLEKRLEYNHIKSPMNIYEFHFGSWKRSSETDGNPFYNYRQVADLLAPYLQSMNYTHLEIMPVCEYPYDGSWGYQITGYYSVTSRYGTPDDFRYFVDRMHEAGIFVIMDWVPSHFCKDAHGLYNFDGTPLYEYANEDMRENKQWGTCNFALDKGEVQSFLISNAVYFMREFHIDGLRVDAVANILYLDYCKTPSVKLRNKYGGRENIEGVYFLRKLNKTLFELFGNPIMAAEESSAWPMVTKPDYLGGLGFNFKWNMGWMNDMLEYIKIDPIYRKWHHNKITFAMMYAYSENYILPLSHDEVVHGKKSMLDKMYGSYNDKFNSLRAFYTFMMGHPGKKLLFMGGEFGQFIEWRYYEELNWNLLDYPAHKNLQTFVSQLNYIYKTEKALSQLDGEPEGFSWIDADNSGQSIVTFIRKAEDERDFLVFVCNFTPVAYRDYRIGVPRFAEYEEILNSDNEAFYGSGLINNGPIKPEPVVWNGQPFSIRLNIPGNGAMIFKPKFLKKKEIQIEQTYPNEMVTVD